MNDKFNMDRIEGYGELGVKGIIIYRKDDEDKRYEFPSQEARDEKLKELDDASDDDGGVVEAQIIR